MPTPTSSIHSTLPSDLSLPSNTLDISDADVPNVSGDLEMACGKGYPRWAKLCVIVLIGLMLSVVIQFIGWLQEEQSRLFIIGLDGMCLYLALGGGAVASIVFGVIYFRPRFRTLVGIGCLFVFALIGASQVLRVDGYYGNRTPRLTWRWAPEADQQIKTYLTSLSKARVNSQGIELFTPTDFDFPELLGKGRLAKIETVDLATTWDSEAPHLLWRHPVGLGWSSFAIVGNAAVSLEQREEYECVVCYDIRNGDEIWSHRELTRFIHEYGDGPRSTPTISDGRVYSMGATGILTCVNFKTGSLLWKQSVFEDPSKQNLIFGMTGSPLVIEGMVVVTPGAGVGASAIAYSAETGSEIWRSGDDQASYASPMAANLCGESQILSFNGQGLRSYAMDGKILWLQPWVTQGDSRVNVAQPIVLGLDDIDEPNGFEAGNPWAKVIISSGYDKGTALLKIVREGSKWSSEVVWESKYLKSKLSNFVVHKDYAYGLDNGQLTCIDLKDGERVWKRGRYGHGKLLLVGDLLLIQAESGEVVLVSASPKASIELAKSPALDSKTWNNLALAGDILAVRNDREAAVFRLPVKHSRSNRLPSVE